MDGKARHTVTQRVYFRWWGAVELAARRKSGQLGVRLKCAAKGLGRNQLRACLCLTLRASVRMIGVSGHRVRSGLYE